MAEIAVAAASAVIRSATGIIGNLVAQEGARLFKLRDSLRWVESQMRLLQSYLESVESRQVGESSGMANLLINIRDLACDVEDIVTEYFPKLTSSKNKNKGFLGCLRSPISSLSYGYLARNFVAEIDNLRTRVEDIRADRDTYELNANNDNGGRSIWDPRRPYLHLDDSNVVGLDDRIRQLEATLLNGDAGHGVISIVGFPGLGKTTLAKRVFKSVTSLNNSTKHHFDCAAFVYVSQHPNIPVLLQEIAEQVKLEEPKCKENLEANLYSFLNERRYLIVLDDIWRTRTWDAASIGIPITSANGSRLIITSRNTEVGLYVGGHNSLYGLKRLSDCDSWELFSKIVEHTPDLESTGRIIVKRCHGVPLAIVVMAGLLKLREKTEHAWRWVLKRMGQDEDLCRQVLALSYKDLPAYLKPCFLYFGLFLEDEEVVVSELINLWMGEGFIPASDGSQESEDIGEDYLNQLIARNLIQVASRKHNGRVRSCRIHDLLHELCVLEGRKGIFFHASNDITTNTTMRVRRVIGHTTNLLVLLSLNPPPSKLRTLITGFDDKNLGSVIKDGGFVIKDKRLKVVGDLHFLTVLRLHAPSSLGLIFPKEIGNLVNLSFLRMDGFRRIEFPSTFSNLTKLLTFDVYRNTYVVVPNVIWKMTELRHIFMYAVALKNKRTEDSLPKLQTLCASDAYCFKAEWLPKFFSLRKLILSSQDENCIKVLSSGLILPKLESLCLNYSSMMEVRAKLNHSRYENLQELYLRGFGELLECANELPPNLTLLEIYATAFRQSELEALGKRLQKLESLSLGAFDYMGCDIFWFVGDDQFPKLETLLVENFENVKLIIEDGGMPRLNKCDLFASNLPVIDVPNHLNMTVNCHKQDLLHCYRLQHVFSDLSYCL